MNRAGLDDADLDALLAAVDALPSPSPRHSEGDIAERLEPSSTLFNDLWWVLDDSDGAESTAETTQRRVTSHQYHSQQEGEATKASSAYSRVVTYRRRAKEELVHLRRRVAELEAQLKAAVSSAHEPTVAPVEAISSSVGQFWRRLAQTESEARQRAVAENLKLRDMLESQLRTAKQLEKLLNKRQIDATTMGGSFHAQATAKRMRRDESVDEKAIFDSLVADLDARYPLVDRVIDECGLSQRKEAFQDAHVRYASDHEASTPCLEFVTATVVPFEFALTRDVAWRALQSPTIPLENGVYQVVEANDDLVKALFTVHTKLRGSDSVSLARFVARRYDEEDRTIVVWGSAASVRGRILKHHRVELREEGWSIVSRLTSGPSEMSLTQACGRLRPQMVVRAGSKSEELVGVLTDTLLDCYHDTQQGLYDFTGRMLLAEATRRQETMDQRRSS